MTSPGSHPKRPKVWHIYRFEQRFELAEDARVCRKGPLLYCREAVSAGDDDARDYCLQRAALRRYDNHLELYGAFATLRHEAADRSRAYRGYLLNGKREPATPVDIRDWLGVSTSQVRKILKSLETVGLIERVEFPEFDLGKNEKPAKAPSSENSGDFRNSPEPFKKGKAREGKGKGTASGNGVGKKNKTNGKEEEEGLGRTKERSPAAPTATVPLLPTEADAQGARRSDKTGGLLGSDIAAHLAAMERRLRGLSPLPPPEVSQYSDRANLFASEIYLALGLNYGRTMKARELGCLAARWNEAERASLPPPVAGSLWDDAVQAASKLRKRRTIKKPGAMFCRVWAALLAKAKMDVLT